MSSLGFPQPETLAECSPVSEPARRHTRRAAIPRRKRKVSEAERALELEASLKRLLKRNQKITPLRALLMEAIAQVHLVATHNRQSDRDAIFKAIFDQGCSIISEMMDDTSLMRSVVQACVDELVAKDLVEIRQPKGSFEDEEIQYLPLMGPSPSSK